VVDQVLGSSQWQWRNGFEGPRTPKNDCSSVMGGFNSLTKGGSGSRADGDETSFGPAPTGDESTWPLRVAVQTGSTPASADHQAAVSQL
jgi:hypothetical protein